MISEIEQDLAGGPPKLLTQLQTDMNELVQDSSVLITEHELDLQDVEEKARKRINKFVNSAVLLKKRS